MLTWFLLRASFLTRSGLLMLFSILRQCLTMCLNYITYTVNMFVEY